MSTKSAAGGSHLGGFQPEELFGQLKAEQVSRNYDMAARFIEAVLGQHVDASRLNESLRDGVVLCRLINTLRPGAVKRINTKTLPFTQMENISNFLAAAQKLGLDSADLFQTVDLYEGKNMPRVVMTLLTIARVVAGIPLHSQRKLVDLHKSLSDGWNSSTLTAHDTEPTKHSRPELQTMHNQKTLVNLNKSGSEVALAKNRSASTSEPDLVLHSNSNSSSTKPNRLRPKPDNTNSNNNNNNHSLQQERRKSKRRSATTLFISSSTGEFITRPPALQAKVSSVSKSVTTEQESSHNDRPELAEELSETEADTSPNAGSTPSTRRSSTCSSGANEDLIDAASSEHICDVSDNVPQKHAVEPGDTAAPQPRKRTNSKNRPKERLTVYSESAQRLTNYQLGNCIGRGQFGSVYRALDLETGQMVAVKQISLEGQDSSNMDDVMQEVDLLKSLSSPRIVRYYGFVKTDTHLNLVMEFVENGSLSATLKSFGSFPEKLVLAYAVKIIEGLIYLHGRDVVHCDLKACNILTTKNGNTKLTDFGVSLNLKLRKPDDESVVAGTPYWMAPEIIQLDGACMASDIWSLGCTLIELLTGKPPYSGMMQMAALYRIVEDDHPPIPEGISEELKDFLLQCFQKDPKARPTAAELMSHSWMKQYGRNRKEMKMLRRTCSRKMSTFIAHKKVEYNYPDFNPSALKQLPSHAEQREDTNDGDIVNDALVRQESDHNVEDVEATPSKATLSSPAIARSVTDIEASVRPSSGQGPYLYPKPRLDQDGDSASILSDNNDDDTDASISTFEGPRVKHHRLRTILCDAYSICAICSKTLSGAFIQCSSCKIRCHDACTQHLQPCTSMRMSRFLCPANRKSSKRYESKTPNIRLRAGRKNAIRRQHSSQSPLPSASYAELPLDDTYKSIFDSTVGSSDGSLRMSQLQTSGSSTNKHSVANSGFDGVLLPNAFAHRPASIAVTSGISETCGYRAYGEMTAPGKAFSFSRMAGEAYDSGWETDDATALDPCPLGKLLPDAQMEQPQNREPMAEPLPVAKIRIPAPQQQNGRGPCSAPLTTSGLSKSVDSRRVIQQRTSQQPMYYQPLSNEPGNSGGSAPSQGIHAASTFAHPPERPRPKSIRRMRANTASLDCLAGSAQLHSDGNGNGSGHERSSISTLLRRRQHPLRSVTSTELKAVAGFSPGAAQRVRRTYHGSDASISDLQSCTSSEALFSRGETGGSSGIQCFSMSGKAENPDVHSRRPSRGDCVIM
ncbi:Protein kinase of the Mitotic Exit Network [Coemansia sp. RSA 2399]|nr:Protein kinase of the Mitotic Exit Network [Coemansia sp. RSA 2399]